VARHSARGREGEIRERAALVGLALRRSKKLEAEHSVEELGGLAEAAGATVVLKMIQERQTPDPATFIGRGKLDELADECERVEADLVIFDNELTPAQQRHIEERVDRKVIDRTQLILDIFARRARTREGKWQVELAQLKYLLPRLVGSGTALSRLGGGIGTRGPGETKLETDRRRIRQRIHSISQEIDSIRKRRHHSRARRQKASVPMVALVGYTNAGKTTLFNLLTKESAEASDALFVTLDPLVRQVSVPDNRQLLLSDTVGFIDRLPHTLVAAFRATLEQVAEADLVLHVVDASSPDRDRHIAAVKRVLEEVGAANVATMDVFNKCDLIGQGEAERLQRLHPGSLCISALKKRGRTEIIDAITEKLELDTRRVTLEFDEHDEDHREKIARVYRHARVVSHVATDGRVAIEADVPRRVLDRVKAAGGER
jgi:GTP-binding protein HflX